MQELKTYQDDHYSRVMTQRNLLLVLIFICILVIGVCVFSITKLSLTKKIDAFVVQIDEDTGITKIVNPVNANELLANEEIAKYFIHKYLVAREGYNSADFSTLARTTVRLMSSNSIYKQYLGYIFNAENDPREKYGENNSTYIKVKSWSKTDDKYIVRFSVYESSGNMSVQHKIAVVNFEYISMELTQEQREINPIGFQIKGYNVSNDNS